MVAEDNPFIRFKNYVNDNVHRGVKTVFGSSALASASTSPTRLFPSFRDSHSNSTITDSRPQQHQQNNSSSTVLSMGRSSSMASNASPENSEGTTSMDDVYAWAIQSPYSPLNLQYLSQPTPQGMHPSWEGRFTFRDAFEDLLVAGSGSPLPSLDEHARKKMMESNLFTTNWGLGAGLGLHVAHWVAEIGVSGLWGSYFDLRPELRNCFDWRPSRRMDMSGLNRRLYFRTRLENGGLFDEWSGQEREVVDRGRDWAEIWHEAMKVVRDVTKYVDGDDNGDADADADADAEEDLYTSRFSTGSHSHSTPKDMRVAERPDTDTNTSVSANTALQKQQHQQYVPEGLEPEQVTTTEYADGSKRVTKTKRKERDGKTEITTTSEHFDADGKLLADTKETTTTRTWSGRLPGAEASFSWTFNKDAKTHTKARGEWNNASDANGEDGHGEDDSQPGRRKDENSGWFWKR